VHTGHGCEGFFTAKETCDPGHIQVEMGMLEGNLHWYDNEKPGTNHGQISVNSFVSLLSYDSLTGFRSKD
jgi:hypothetical protein